MRFLAGLGAFVAVSVVETAIIGFVVLSRDPETSVWFAVSAGAICLLVWINVIVGLIVGEGD